MDLLLHLRLSSCFSFLLFSLPFRLCFFSFYPNRSYHLNHRTDLCSLNYFQNSHSFLRRAESFPFPESLLAFQILLDFGLRLVVHRAMYRLRHLLSDVDNWQKQITILC